MRIISLLASGTEIVCGLGAGEWLVGRSHECDNPPWVSRLPVCTQPAFDIVDVQRANRRGSAPAAQGGRAALSRRHATDRFPRAGPADHPGALRSMRSHAGGRRAGRLRRREPGAGAPGRQRAGYLSTASLSIGRALGREQDAANLVAAMKSRMSAVSTRSSTIVRRSLSRSSGLTRCLRWATGDRSSFEAANGRLLLGEKGEHSRADRLAAGASKPIPNG